MNRGGAAFVKLLDQRGEANRRLTVGFGILVGAACFLDIPGLIRAFPAGVDLEIPLRAAAHWASGAQAYPPSAMLVKNGPDLPYLYPPFLLPLLTPIAALPRAAVTDVWLIFCFVCAVWTCCRLAIPWPAIPFVLAWPPFAEGLITGNVQILSFAVFVALLYDPSDGVLRTRVLAPGQDPLNGLLAGAVGALKVAQLLPVLYLARRRLRAALFDVGALAGVVIATLPLTGISIYGDWLAQVQRAADPSWVAVGASLGRTFTIPDVFPAALGVVMALSVRGRNSGAWLGVALLIAAPSIHGYTYLFLLPGLLTIRRDISIPVAAVFLGIYNVYAWWLPGLLTVGFMLASNRWHWLRLVDRNSDRRPSRGSAGLPDSLSS